MTTLPAAPDVTAQTAITAALDTLTPFGPVAWGALPVGTVGRLLRDSGDADYLRRAWVAQRQDAGVLSAYVASAGWATRVIVRCLAADAADAQHGRALADSAMATADGVIVRRIPDIPPYPTPDADGIYTYAYLYEVTVR